MVFTSEESADMLLILGECHGNFSAAERLYRERYPHRQPQSRMVFQRLFTRVRASGSVHPSHNRQNVIRRPVRDDRSADILAAVTVDPHISTRRLAIDSGMSQKTVCRILKDQKWHPYHINLHQALSVRDFPNRVNFCNWLRAQNIDFSRQVLWTDEATFKNTGDVNIHNAHYWSPVNPHWLRQVDKQHPWSVNVWCGIIGGSIIGPYFFDGNLTGNQYAAFLENILPILLEEIPLGIRQTMWFQQDGCPAHYALIARQRIDATFGARWIGRGGPVAWPARSPDLTPLDFYLWGRIKEMVYKEAPTTRQDMMNRIQVACRSLSGEEISRAVNSVSRRAQRCIRENGRHFEHLPKD